MLALFSGRRVVAARVEPVRDGLVVAGRTGVVWVLVLGAEAGLGGVLLLRTASSRLGLCRRGDLGGASLMTGLRGIDWLELRGTFGYRIAAMGLCSATGLSCLSSSSGGVGSSGSVLSKLVSLPAEDVRLTARGGYVGLVTVMAAGMGLTRR